MKQLVQNKYETKTRKIIKIFLYGKYRTSFNQTYQVEWPSVSKIVNLPPFFEIWAHYFCYSNMYQNKATKLSYSYQHFLQLTFSRPKFLETDFFFKFKLKLMIFTLNFWFSQYLSPPNKYIYFSWFNDKKGLNMLWLRSFL